MNMPGTNLYPLWERICDILKEIKYNLYQMSQKLKCLRKEHKDNKKNHAVNSCYMSWSDNQMGGRLIRFKFKTKLKLM
jgi:hypothetical protein